MLWESPQRQIPVGDELRRVGAENQALLSGGPVKGAVFDFAPEINQFLQTHLFGDIFPAITSTGKAANWQLSELWRPRRVWRHSYCRICAPVSALA